VVPARDATFTSAPREIATTFDPAMRTPDRAHRRRPPQLRPRARGRHGARHPVRGHPALFAAEVGDRERRHERPLPGADERVPDLHGIGRRRQSLRDRRRGRRDRHGDVAAAADAQRRRRVHVHHIRDGPSLGPDAEAKEKDRMMAKRTLMVIAGAAVAAGVAWAPAANAGPDVPLRLAQAQQGQPATNQGGRGMGPGGGGMGPGGGMQQSRMFEQWDRDDDGFLSREEFVEGERRGRMSDTPMAEQNRAQMFEQLDEDGDGRLSLDEMPQPRTGANR
jgi:hypothetical protein